LFKFLWTCHCYMKDTECCHSVRMKNLQDPARLSNAYSALVPCNQGRPLSSCNVCYMLIATKSVNRMFTKREAKKLDSSLGGKMHKGSKKMRWNSTQASYFSEIFQFGVVLPHKKQDIRISPIIISSQ